MEWNLTDNCFYLLDNFSELPTIQTLGNIFGGVPAFRMHFVTVYILYSVLWQILHSWYEIADLFCMTEFFLIIFTIEQLH